jgi:hypothetical protein
VTTPQDPEEEPVGDELAEERPEVRPDAEAEAGPVTPPAAGPPDGLSREDELWQAIVENYGERPQIEELEVEVPPSPRDLTTVDEPVEEGSDTIDKDVPADAEEHFVPPPPPPLPKPPPARLLAWLGLFGVPTFVLVTLVAGISLPSWLGLLLMGWFVGGFVFLVASMKPDPGGGSDDGARI